MSFQRPQNIRSARKQGLNQQKHRRRASPRAATHRPNFESLEDRRLLSFSPAVSYPVSGPQAVVTGDFNGDGRLDLAVANFESTVSVLLGDGNGTFQEPGLASPTGADPRSMAVGDFNGDGKLDVATANAFDVSVLLGNGDGTFQTPTNINIGSDPVSFAVGDFNGDGKLDLGVTSNATVLQGFDYYGDPIYGSEGYANVLLGNGDGSFAGPNVNDLGAGFHESAAAADFNGDALDDFVTVNEDYGYVEVLPGDGSGYLQGPSGFSIGDYSYSVAAGDVNADGHTDLVTANGNGNSVGVLLGDGAGGFSGPVNYATGGNTPTSVVLGDFTGDGKADVATANYSSDTVSVLYGNGDGTFSSAVHSAAGSNPFPIAAGDINGDGWLDAATANTGGGDVSVLINDHSWPAPPPPDVSINDVSVTEGSTGTTSATFTLSLSFASGTPITVHYATADGSATAGSEYLAASGDVTFAPAQTSKVVTVAVLGDRVAEPTETFAVNLSSPTNAFIGDGQGVGTILDDEPRVSIGNAAVTEGNTGSVNATFTVSLSAAYDAAVTVHYATANGTATAGSDYLAASGDVTFAPGQTSKVVTVAVLGDRVAEPTETFAVNLSSPSADAAIAVGQGVGTILDDEPRISINSVSTKEGNGGTTQFIFTVSLSAAYDQPVTVNYSTANGTATAGSDYQAKSGTLTFAPGQTTQTITIVVYGDKTAESDETFFVNLNSPSSNAFFLAPQGIGTILDDDGIHGNGKH